MRRPLFMGNSLVGIRLLLVEDMPVDPVYETRADTVEAAYGPELRIPGQPRFTNNKRVDPRVTGDAEKVDGYVTFARDTLLRRGVDPEQLKGGRVTGYMRGGTWVPEEFEIKGQDPTGHLPSVGPILVMIRLRALKDLKGSP